MALGWNKKPDLEVGPYRELEAGSDFQRDHVPASHAIWEYSKKRYGYKGEEQSFENKIKDVAFTWKIPKEIHEQYSRTYGKARSAAATDEDRERFKQYLIDHKQVKAKTTAQVLEDDVRTNMSLMEDVTVNGSTWKVPVYLKLSVERDVEVLRPHLKKHYTKESIDEAAGQFLVNLFAIDRKLALNSAIRDQRDPINSTADIMLVPAWPTHAAPPETEPPRRQQPSASGVTAARSEASQPVVLSAADRAKLGGATTDPLVR